MLMDATRWSASASHLASCVIGLTKRPARTEQIRLGAEQLIRESGMEWTILRRTMIYGAPGDRNLSWLLTLLHWVPILPVPGAERHLQQPVHVADLAGVVLVAVERPVAAGTTYNVASPATLRVADLQGISERTVAILAGVRTLGLAG